MKKSFSILELIFTISLIALLYTMFIPNFQRSKIDELVNKLVIYLNYTRYQALIDDKYEVNEDLWFKKRWTMKFFRCRSDVGGVYFSIYSDRNLTGQPSSEDSLKDPLTNKNIYTSNYCTENEKNSNYVLLTKNYDIVSVDISCNSTSSLGQISFGNDGRVYSKLGTQKDEAYDYEILEDCYIELTDKYEKRRELLINPKTGYSKVVEN